MKYNIQQTYVIKRLLNYIHGFRLNENNMENEAKEFVHFDSPIYDDLPISFFVDLYETLCIETPVGDGRPLGFVYRPATSRENNTPYNG